MILVVFHLNIVSTFPKQVKSSHSWLGRAWSCFTMLRQTPYFITKQVFLTSIVRFHSLHYQTYFLRKNTTFFTIIQLPLFKLLFRFQKIEIVCFSIELTHTVYTSSKKRIVVRTEHKSQLTWFSLLPSVKLLTL